MRRGEETGKIYIQTRFVSGVIASKVFFFQGYNNINCPQKCLQFECTALDLEIGNEYVIGNCGNFENIVNHFLKCYCSSLSGKPSQSFWDDYCILALSIIINPFSVSVDPNSSARERRNTTRFFPIIFFVRRIVCLHPNICCQTSTCLLLSFLPLGE